MFCSGLQSRNVFAMSPMQLHTLVTNGPRPHYLDRLHEGESRRRRQGSVTRHLELEFEPSRDSLACVEGIQEVFHVARRLSFRKVPAPSHDFDEPLFVCSDVVDIGLCEVGPPFLQFIEKNVPLFL